MANTKKVKTMKILATAVLTLLVALMLCFFTHTTAHADKGFANNESNLDVGRINDWYWDTTPTDVYCKCFTIDHLDQNCNLNSRLFYNIHS